MKKNYVICLVGLVLGIFVDSIAQCGMQCDDSIYKNAVVIREDIATVYANVDDSEQAIKQGFITIFLNVIRALKNPVEIPLAMVNMIEAVFQVIFETSKTPQTQYQAEMIKKMTVIFNNLSEQDRQELLSFLLQQIQIENADK